MKSLLDRKAFLQRTFPLLLPYVLACACARTHTHTYKLACTRTHTFTHILIYSILALHGLLQLVTFLTERENIFFYQLHRKYHFFVCLLVTSMKDAVELSGYTLKLEWVMEVVFLFSQEGWRVVLCPVPVIACSIASWARSCLLYLMHRVVPSPEHGILRHLLSTCFPLMLIQDNFSALCLHLSGWTLRGCALCVAVHYYTVLLLPSMPGTSVLAQRPTHCLCHRDVCLN